MSSINANATVTLTVNGKQAQDMLDNLKKKSPLDQETPKMGIYKYLLLKGKFII